MADKTFSKTCSAVGSFSYAGNFKLYVELTNTSEDVSANTSKVKYNVYCQKPSDKGGSIDAKHLKYFKINGKEIINSTANVDASGYPAKISIASGTTDAIKHNSDGTKTITFSAKIKASSFGVSAAIEDSFTLKTISRHFTSKPTFSKNSKTETTYTFNWNTSETCSRVELHLNGSSTANAVWTGSAKSGTITATNLTPGKSYSAYIKCTRKDSNLTSNSDTKTGYETYGYPKCEVAPDFIIGNQVSLRFYNPLNRTIKIQMWSHTGGFVSDMITINGGNTYTGFGDIVGRLYSSIPYSNGSRYNIDVYYNGNKNVKEGGTYYIRGNEVPTFNGNINIFSDKYYSLTGNIYKVILGYSNVMATIPYSQKASGNNFSSISKYRMNVGNQSTEVNEDVNSDISMMLENVTSNQVTVAAIDTRGLTTSRTVLLEAINYFNIKINSLSAKRTNNIEPETTLNFNISFWNGNFGAVTNTIKTIYYKYKKTTESTWITGTTNLTYNISGNTATGSVIIKGDLGDEGFNIENSYNLYLYVKDELSETNAYYILSTGLPAIAIYGNKVAIGQKYNINDSKDVLQVGGNAYIQGMLSHHYTGAFNTAMWFYIGDFKFSRQGEYVELNGYYGDGQNGNPKQQVIFKLTMMKGWEGRDNNIGLTVNFEQNYLSTMSFKINQTSKKECSLYIYFPSAYPTFSYTITGGAISFVEKNESLSSEPVGTKWATIYHKEYVDYLRIAKGVNLGIANSDGLPIIRDHGNNNVTVDATGGVLFLGFENTTGLNILNGKIKIDNDGDIETSRYITSSVNITSTGGSLIAGDTSGSSYIRCNSNGNFSATGNIYLDTGAIRSANSYNNDTVTNSANVYISSNGWFRRTTGSSERWKTDITEEIEDRLNPEALYELPIKQFKYKDDCISETDVRYGKNILGFIAEDVAKIYEPAVQYDEDGNVEMWNAQVMTPAILKLVQNQNKKQILHNDTLNEHTKEINNLKETIKEIQTKINNLL